jgi:hypothetical protein
MWKLLFEMESIRKKKERLKMKKSQDLPEWTISVKMENSFYVGSTAEEILKQIKQADFSIPSSVYEYKLRAARRAQVMGHHLIFWDATSFLMAAQTAGLLKVTFNFENAKKEDC